MSQSFFLYQGHRLLQGADALPDFPAFQVNVVRFPFWLPETWRQNGYSLQFNHRLMEEVGNLLRRQLFISATTLSQRESNFRLPRSKSLLSWDASSPSV